MSRIIAELSTPDPTDNYIWARVLNKWIAAPIPNDVDDPEEALPALAAELEKAGYTPAEPITGFAAGGHRTIELKHTPTSNAPGVYTAIVTINPHQHARDSDPYTLVGTGSTEQGALAALVQEIGHPTGWDHTVGNFDAPDYDGEEPYTVDSVSDYAIQAHDARSALLWVTENWSPTGN